MLLVHSCSVAGMMDTVLNLGLNDITVEALAKKSGDRRFAFDSYRRFVQMYSDVVLGIEINHFEKHLERAKEKRGVKQENLIIVVTMLCFEYVVLFLLLSAKLLIGIRYVHLQPCRNRLIVCRSVRAKMMPRQDCELLPEDLEKLVKSYKAVVQLELGEEFPEDPKAQLWGAVGAVFNSWMNQRAKTYRPPVIVRGRAREDLETIRQIDTNRRSYCTWML